MVRKSRLQLTLSLRHINNGDPEIESSERVTKEISDIIIYINAASIIANCQLPFN